MVKEWENPVVPVIEAGQAYAKLVAEAKARAALERLAAEARKGN